MKTRVLIVDDSVVFRSGIEECLSGEEDIQVIGLVRNGMKAIEFIRTGRRPHLVTLDVEMPEMDGLATLTAIQEINRSDTAFPPIGVIMVSAHTKKDADTTIMALEAGAFDFITKPKTSSQEESREILKRQLLVKIRYFASKLISSRLAGRHQTFPVHPKPFSSGKQTSSGKKALLIGVSTGGPKALAEILPQLCERTNIPIFIVQHMPADFTQSLAASLDAKCRHKAREGEHLEIVKNNHIYIAPGDRHMLLRRKGNDVVININRQPPENGSRPSVDVLFRSAPLSYGSNIIAMVLTGMGNDGTRGIQAVKRAGGYVIAQDEKSSIVWGMPGSAVASGYVDDVISLGDIPVKLIRLL